METFDSISHVGSSSSPSAFEQLYLSLRKKERRIYSDEQLTILPDVPKTYPYAKEWQIRKRSYQRLASYLKQKKKPLKILEIGCGNGWLAAKLANISGTTVLAIDTNTEEINQGRRVFKNCHLQLVRLDFETAKLAELKFDVILFAASIQYFKCIKSIVDKAKQQLNADGEIHILDTNFYDPQTISNAKKRTAAYFSKLGYPEMSAYYFHHQLDELQNFNPKIIYHPKSLINRIFVKNPFYWISIKLN